MILEYKSTILLLSFIIFVLKRYFNGGQAMNQKSLKGKIIIVTGASDGIGVPTTQELLKNGAFVILACRNEAKTNSLINSFDKKYKENCIFMKLDLSSFESIKSFCEEIKKKFNKIDILVNNAGAVFNKYELTCDNIEQTFQVNTFGPMILTQELLSIVSEKIINVASKSHTRITFDLSIMKSWENNSFLFNKANYGKYINYCYSKLGNVYFNQYLAEYIEKNNLKVKTAALHPGTIHTEIARDVSLYLKIAIYIVYPIFWLITKTINSGAQTTLYLCYEDKNFINGEYYKDCHQTPVAPHALDKNLRNMYIEWSRNMISYYGEKAKVKFNIKV